MNYLHFKEPLRFRAKRFLCLILVAWATSLSAQITTNEQPYGLQEGSSGAMKAQSAIILPAPDMRQVQVDDSITELDTAITWTRFAYPVLCNYTMDNSGVWQRLADGTKIWRLKLTIPGALSIHAYYDRFWLPEGSKFFVYSEETQQSIGAITSEFIGGSEEDPISFATALIYGETVVFEYYQPPSVEENPIVSINRIDYGYRLFHEGGRGSECRMEIGGLTDALVNQSRAVTSIIVPDGSGSAYFTGALVNNTNNDNTPYLLTTGRSVLHAGLDALGNANAAQWLFLWDDSTYGNNILSTTGATIVANGNYANQSNLETDFALLRLSQDPRALPEFFPCYLGWDRDYDEPSNPNVVKFGYVWNATVNLPPQRRLLDWLDPKKTNATNLSGMAAMRANRAGILHVKVGGSGNKSGSDWANAIDGMANAISTASNPSTNPPVGQIWVAAGTYYPTITNQRDISFVLPDSVECYGGFPSNASSVNSPDTSYRNPILNVTTLSGDIGIPDDNSDNTYSVVIANDYTHLDGFAICNGNADSTGIYVYGGGVRVRGVAKLKNLYIHHNFGIKGGGMAILDANPGMFPEIENVKIKKNVAVEGGGLFCTSIWQTDLLYTLTKISIKNNVAYNSGGGIYIDNVQLKLDKALITGNTVIPIIGGGGHGGGIYQDYTRPSSVYSTDFTNILLADNGTQGEGGALYINNGTCNLMHATISGNVDVGSNVQGVKLGSSAAINIQNSILYYNTPSTPNLIGIMYSYSLIEGLSSTANHNLDGTVYGPSFVNHTSSPYDYQLTDNSECRFMGDNSLLLSFPDLTIDLAGNFRRTSVDLGAYDNQDVVPVPEDFILYVTVTGAGLMTGSSWADAYAGLAPALQAAKRYNVPNIRDIYVGSGVYYPTTTDERNVSFELINVNCYGGFPADGGIPKDQRDWDAYPTILSGNIGDTNDIYDNSRHVVTMDANSRIDGFKIKDGCGDIQDYGGGLLVNSDDDPVGSHLENLEIFQNQSAFGGGVAFLGGCPTIKNCIIHQNQSTDKGGGLFTHNASLSAKRLIIRQNWSLNGGGVFCSNILPANGYMPVFEDVSIHLNEAGSNGGAIYNEKGIAVFLNALIFENLAAMGATVYNSSDDGSQIIIVHATMTKLFHPWPVMPPVEIVEGIVGTCHIFNSIIALDDNHSPYVRAGNNYIDLATDPFFQTLFMNPANGDYSLIQSLFIPNVSGHGSYYGINHLVSSIIPYIHIHCHGVPEHVESDITNNWRDKNRPTYGAYEYGPTNPPFDFLNPWTWEYFRGGEGNNGDTTKRKRKKDASEDAFQESTDWNVFAYPNPTANGEQIRVVLTNGFSYYDHPVQLKLYSTQGVLLFDSAYPTGVCVVNSPTIAPGVYVIRLYTAEGAVYTQKLVVF